MEASNELKCPKCNIECHKMTYFYICPGCMADYATDNDMDIIYSLHRAFDGNMDQVMVAVQHLIDADREQLRCLLLHKDQFFSALEYMKITYADILNSPGMNDYDRTGTPYWEVDNEE